MPQQPLNPVDHEFCDRAKSHIQRNNDLFRHAIDSLPNPFYVIDVNTFVIQMANSATHDFGEIKEGTTCYELTHNRKSPCSGQNHGCPIAAVKKSIKPAVFEHIHFDKTGSPRYFEIHGYPICGKNGAVVQMIEYALDITDRKNAEAALRNANDNLERRVSERTHDIELVNAALHKEITEHKRTEKNLREHQQKLRSVTSELTIAEERQRRQLAIDLHDSIGQALALSQIKLSQVQQSIQDEEISGQLRDIHALLENAVQHTRTMTFELSPPLLNDIGLDAALEWLTESFQERHGIQTKFHNEQSEKIKDDDIRLMLYRIARELLINVVKHACADSVTVSIKSLKKAIKIEIVDDGVGFDPRQLKRRHHEEDGFGLFSIGERMKFIGGEFCIHSKPGHGARALILAPLRRTIPK
ncbi:hypothetical protein DRI50_10615 [candidate division KSB1 bacterium]|nr:MAG: hypothetical protein DRI50_10615 [candidate division KSB1 bacterium]